MKVTVKSSNQPIKANEERTYTVSVGFGGFVGSELEIEVDASSKDEAIDLAIEEAKDELFVESVEQTDDDEYTVVIGFGGFAGVELEYEVTADDEEEAGLAGIEEAGWDLSGKIV